MTVVSGVVRFADVARQILNTCVKHMTKLHFYLIYKSDQLKQIDDEEWCKITHGYPLHQSQRI